MQLVWFVLLHKWHPNHGITHVIISMKVINMKLHLSLAVQYSIYCKKIPICGTTHMLKSLYVTDVAAMCHEVWIILLNDT